MTGRNRISLAVVLNNLHRKCSNFHADYKCSVSMGVSIPMYLPQNQISMRTHEAKPEPLHPSVFIVPRVITLKDIFRISFTDRYQVVN
jgi:hypothetical protein